MILHIFVHISLLQALPPQEPFLFLSVLCSSSMEESDHQKQLQGWKKSSSESRTTDQASTQLSSRSSGVQEVKLAAIAIGLNVTLRSSQMPAQMQEGAFRCARSFLDSSDPNNNNPKPHRPNPSLLARALKKEFDCEYGPAWHCVVGKSFGSFVTHSPGGFLYFSIDSLSVLLFKTEVKLVTE